MDPKTSDMMRFQCIIRPTGSSAPSLFVLQPQVNYNEWCLLYFISFLLLVGFFVLNMFVGVVVENFHKCRENQEKEESARRAASHSKKLEKKRKSEWHWALELLDIKLKLKIFFIKCTRFTIVLFSLYFCFIWLRYLWQGHLDRVMQFRFHFISVAQASWQHWICG